MAFDPKLAQRLAEHLTGRSGFELKKMFGGIAWLLNGNMCVGVYQDYLIIRVGESKDNELLPRPYVKVMGSR